MTLTEFLLARIAEDEAEAHILDQHYMRSELTGPNLFVVDEGPAIAMWPDRALRECEAKRRIVELHYEISASDIAWSDCGVCPSRHGRGWPCDTLRTLARPYADHPDFREEWRA